MTCYNTGVISVFNHQSVSTINDSDVGPTRSDLSARPLGGSPHERGKRFVLQLAFADSNGLVQLAHRQQIIHHTPTGMAEHRC